MDDNSNENTAPRTTIPFAGKLDSRDDVKNNPRPFEELPEEVQRILMQKGSKSVRARSSLSVMESKHMLSIIVYLDRMSPVLKSDIYNDISRCSNMADKLEDLRSLGLLEIYNTGRTNSNVVMITEKGRKVAESIKEIIELLQ